MVGFPCYLRLCACTNVPCSESINTQTQNDLSTEYAFDSVSQRNRQPIASRSCSSVYDPGEKKDLLLISDLFCEDMDTPQVVRRKSTNVRCGDDGWACINNELFLRLKFGERVNAMLLKTKNECLFTDKCECRLCVLASSCDLRVSSGGIRALSDYDLTYTLTTTTNVPLIIDAAETLGYSRLETLLNDVYRLLKGLSFNPDVIFDFYDTSTKKTIKDLVTFSLDHASSERVAKWARDVNRRYTVVLLVSKTMLRKIFTHERIDEVLKKEFPPSAKDAEYYNMLILYSLFTEKLVFATLSRTVYLPAHSQLYTPEDMRIFEYRHAEKVVINDTLLRIPEWLNSLTWGCLEVLATKKTRICTLKHKKDASLSIVNTDVDLSSGAAGANVPSSRATTTEDYTGSVSRTFDKLILSSLDNDTVSVETIFSENELFSVHKLVSFCSMKGNVMFLSTPGPFTVQLIRCKEITFKQNTLMSAFYKVITLKITGDYDLNFKFDFNVFPSLSLLYTSQVYFNDAMLSALKNRTLDVFFCVCCPFPLNSINPAGASQMKINAESFFYVPHWSNELETVKNYNESPKTVLIFLNSMSAIDLEYLFDSTNGSIVLSKKIDLLSFFKASRCIDFVAVDLMEQIKNNESLIRWKTKDFSWPLIGNEAFITESLNQPTDNFFINKLTNDGEVFFLKTASYITWSTNRNTFFLVACVGNALWKQTLCSFHVILNNRLQSLPNVGEVDCEMNKSGHNKKILYEISSKTKMLYLKEILDPDNQGCNDVLWPLRAYSSLDTLVISASADCFKNLESVLKDVKFNATLKTLIVTGTIKLEKLVCLVKSFPNLESLSAKVWFADVDSFVDAVRNVLKKLNTLRLLFDVTQMSSYFSYRIFSELDDLIKNLALRLYPIKFVSIFVCCSKSARPSPSTLNTELFKWKEPFTVVVDNALFKERNDASDESVPELPTRKKINVFRDRHEDSFFRLFMKRIVYQFTNRICTELKEMENLGLIKDFVLKELLNEEDDYYPLFGRAVFQD